MKIWKLLGVTVVCLALVALVGCGQAEKEPEPETEVEPAVTEMVAVDYAPSAEEIGTEIACAVCGMKMAVTAEMPAVMYDGKPYYFCSAEEKAEFAAAPKDYLIPTDETKGEIK